MVTNNPCCPACPLLAAVNTLRTGLDLASPLKLSHVCGWLQDVFKVCKKVFAALPLAAVVGGQTLILHGGTYPQSVPTPLLLTNV